MNFQFDDYLQVSQIFQGWNLMLQVDFALDVFILFCWGIWMVTNDVTFRNKNPEVEECKRYVIVEALLLLHRTKPSLTPRLETWITENL
jgi:hypothetical protein